MCLAYLQRTYSIYRGHILSIENIFYHSGRYFTVRYLAPVQRTYSIYREQFLSSVSAENIFCLQGTHSIYTEHILPIGNILFQQRIYSTEYTFYQKKQFLGVFSLTSRLTYQCQYVYRQNMFCIDRMCSLQTASLRVLRISANMYIYIYIYCRLSK